MPSRGLVLGMSVLHVAGYGAPAQRHPGPAPMPRRTSRPPGLQNVSPNEDACTHTRFSAMHQHPVPLVGCRRRRAAHAQFQYCMHLCLQGVNEHAPSNALFTRGRHRLICSSDSHCIDVPYLSTLLILDRSRSTALLYVGAMRLPALEFPMLCHHQQDCASLIGSQLNGIGQRHVVLV